MKIVRRIFVFVFVFIVALFAFLNVKTSADALVTDDQIQVLGAGVRTSGNAGIRFVGSVGTFDTTNVASYGIAIAFGEATASDGFALGGTINGKSVLFAQDTALDESGYFYVVLYGVPEDSYTQKVTARAYVVLDNDDVVYASTVTTRNLAEVAVKAKNDGFSGGLIDAVVSNLEANYKVLTKTSINNVVVSDVNTETYSYADLADLWAEFISDYNAATSSSLTTSSTASNLWNSLLTGIVGGNTTRTFPQNCNAVKFFSGANFVKWSWLLEYFSQRGANTHVKNQATALLREDRTCQTYNGYQLVHLSASIWNFFNEGTIESELGYSANVYGNGETSYANVTWPTPTDFASSDVYKIGSEATLPLTALDHTGYTFAGFICNDVPYAIGGAFSITNEDKIFTPTYNVNVYSITYLDEMAPVALLPDSYTIETATFELPVLPDDESYLFAGWFDNPGLNGAAITEIPVGSFGDKVFYASWVENTPTTIDLTPAQVAIIEAYNPTKFVNNDFLGGKYIINGTTYNFADGTTLFKTIAQANEAASDNDVIFVFPGTYSDSFTISNSGLKLIGNNVNIHGSDERATESVISGVVTITGSGVEFNGFDMSTTGRISVKASNVLISSLVSRYNGARNTDFIMLEATQSGTIVEKVNAVFSSTSRFVTANNAAYIISDAIVRNNYAKGYYYSKKGAGGSYVDGIKFQAAAGTIMICNNTLDGFDQFPVFIGSSSNNCSKISIIENNFSRGGNYQEMISIRASKAGMVTEVIGNTFTNCMGKYVINVRGTISENCVTIAYNKFMDEIDATAPQKYLTSAGYTEPFVVEYNYFGTTPTTTTVQTSAGINNTCDTPEDVDAQYALR